MNTSSQTRAIVKKLRTLLVEKPDGYVTNTCRLMEEAGLDPNSFSDDSLCEIHAALCRSAYRHDMLLNSGNDIGARAGIGYDMDFTLVRLTRYCGGVQVKTPKETDTDEYPPCDTAEKEETN